MVTGVWAAGSQNITANNTVSFVAENHVDATIKVFVNSELKDTVTFIYTEEEITTKQLSLDDLTIVNDNGSRQCEIKFVIINDSPIEENILTVTEALDSTLTNMTVNDVTSEQVANYTESIEYSFTFKVTDSRLDASAINAWTFALVASK